MAAKRILTEGNFAGIGHEGQGHAEAAAEAVARALQVAMIDAVAHRVVHGGAALRGPVRIDATTRAQIDAATALAPLHNPAALAAIDAVGDELPGVPMVAVFDTGFHASMPPRAATYPIERELAERHQIQRYGFHGLAHRYMMERYAALGGAGRRLITLQLGSGCSAAAIEDGKVVDTSMGLTPLEGLMMETRSGDVDPSLIAYLAREEHADPATVEEWLNQRSGLLGVSGLRDMRQLLQAESQGDDRARLALEMFVYRIRKYIGAYTAALGGADAIVFGGGVGENAAPIRARVVGGFEWLGARLDDTANQATAGVDARISAADSAIEVWVIAVDEAVMLAREAYRYLTSG